MKIQLTESIQSKYPDLKITFVLAKDIVVEGPDEKTKEILENIYPEVRQKYNVESLESDLHSQAYINFAKSLGVSPDSAFLPHLQIKRVLKGKGIGNINNIVNSYMALELKYNLSFSAYDFDTLGPELNIDLAKGGEEFVPIGGQKVTLKTNDFIFYDVHGILYSFAEGYRDSSKVTANTKNVLFTIDMPKGIDGITLTHAINELIAEYPTSNFIEAWGANADIILS